MSVNFTKSHSWRACVILPVISRSSGNTDRKFTRFSGYFRGWEEYFVDLRDFWRYRVGLLRGDWS